MSSLSLEFWNLTWMCVGLRVFHTSSWGHGGSFQSQNLERTFLLLFLYIFFTNIISTLLFPNSYGINVGLVKTCLHHHTLFGTIFHPFVFHRTEDRSIPQLWLQDGQQSLMLYSIKCPVRLVKGRSVSTLLISRGLCFWPLCFYSNWIYFYVFLMNILSSRICLRILIKKNYLQFQETSLFFCNGSFSLFLILHPFGFSQESDKLPLLLHGSWWSNRLEFSGVSRSVSPHVSLYTKRQGQSSRHFLGTWVGQRCEPSRLPAGKVHRK